MIPINLIKLLNLIKLSGITLQLYSEKWKNVWETDQNIIINQRCCYNQDAFVLFMLSNLGAFVFEFTLNAVIIKIAVLFAPIR